MLKYSDLSMIYVVWEYGVLQGRVLRVGGSKLESLGKRVLKLEVFF